MTTNTLPKHIAIIPDGNRRWAKENGLKAVIGHSKGVDNLSEIVIQAKEIGIEVLTFYVFSTENWRRSAYEIKYLIQLLHKFLDDKLSTMQKNGVSFHTIGNLSKFSEKTQEKLTYVKKQTKDNTKLKLIFALNYGGRDDITRAVQAICQNDSHRKSVTEELISSYLDTHKWPDPDLLIRTSGEIRLSNFLLWQLSYTEIYKTDTLWPDFTHEEFTMAILDYQKRKRRHGGD